MRWISFTTILFLTACAPPGSEDTADMRAGSGNAPSATGEWQTLFDGTDLSAFRMTGDANWTIEGDTVGADAG
ncbi:MAG: hypothetical protein PVF63_06105, partial [Gammaproteobacteria bacterium]